jgi:hypothetical protein
MGIGSSLRAAVEVQVLPDLAGAVAGLVQPYRQSVVAIELWIAPLRRIPLMTPWLWACWPVRKVARDGQHSDRPT